MWKSSHLVRLLVLLLLLIIRWLFQKNENCLWRNPSQSPNEFAHYLGNYEMRVESLNATSEQPCFLPSEDLEHDVYGINLRCSEEVPIERSFPDTRPEECMYKQYSRHLPNVTVAFIWKNAPWTVIARAVSSVIRRTPKKLLREIFLLDMSSEGSLTAQEVDMYFDSYGLRIRTFNASDYNSTDFLLLPCSEALGEVVVYLSAFTEVNVNWLPPLLAPIRKNKSVITEPIFDFIDERTFEYREVAGSGARVGVFDWHLRYREGERARGGAQATAPFATPVLAGAAFAASTRFLKAVGGPGLRAFEGDGVELAWRAWRCGGAVLRVPCSRVGRLFNARAPAPQPAPAPVPQPASEPAEARRRLYAVAHLLPPRDRRLFLTVEPLADTPSDLTPPQPKCLQRSFNWYLNHVAGDVFHNFPAPPPNARWGELVSEGLGRCLLAPSDLTRSSAEWGQSLRLGPCPGAAVRAPWRLNVRGQLALGERCMRARTGRDGERIAVLVACAREAPLGPWAYDARERTLEERGARSRLCLAANRASLSVQLVPCEDAAAATHYLKWIFRPLASQPPEKDFLKIWQNVVNIRV